MAPTPTARDEAARHGADRPAHPDGSIDVNDPDGDGQDGRRGMDDRRPALLLDAGLEAEGGLEVAKTRFPEPNTGHEQDANQDGLRPEHKLLAGIVLAKLRQVVLIVGAQHVPNARQPHEIGDLGQVLPKEAQEQADKADYQHQANPGVQPAHCGATPKEPAQPKQAGMEQRQPAQQQKHETGGHDPVVDAGASRIAAHANVLACPALVFTAHDFPPARRSAFSSSVSDTRLAPCNMWCAAPAAAVRAMTAMPAYFPTPFQASTSGLIRGASGSPA